MKIASLHNVGEDPSLELMVLVRADFLVSVLAQGSLFSAELNLAIRALIQDSLVSADLDLVVRVPAIDLEVRRLAPKVTDPAKISLTRPHIRKYFVPQQVSQSYSARLATTQILHKRTTLESAEYRRDKPPGGSSHFSTPRPV